MQIYGYSGFEVSKIFGLEIVHLCVCMGGWVGVGVGACVGTHTYCGFWVGVGV